MDHLARNRFYRHLTRRKWGDNISINIDEAEAHPVDAVAIFKALGQPQRYALFLDLLQGEGTSCCVDVAPGEPACCVIDFTQRHRLAQSTISHHLQVLVDTGLVTVERRGTYRVYAVNQPLWTAFQRYVAGLTLCADAEDRRAMGKIPQA
ncbi:MAG: hypothetical protein C7B45_07840 [Sulfobacillus acidophilus]|uniref:HTH arsR-type domain-containing protein n=1 Tax=Sulfobacillus acidophilus TaxID=53633 RepID=A0A2T2WIS7_9FIRM|nr:MAG: hypothetical protein C7B45_07840 [Sulfobacillus acidophilus]